MSNIKYEIEPVFKIEFFKIECINFNNKKKKLEKVLERYPEMPEANFASNRNKCSINKEFREIFDDEFKLIQTKFNKKNPNTWNTFSIPFEVGKFILFPSYFQHSVPENKTKIVRKSVSMNIVPKGRLGDKTSLTELLFNRVIQ